MEPSGNEMVELLKYCLMLDAEAYAFYNRTAGKCSDEKLKKFWYRMAEEEREHVEFWKKAKSFAEKGLLPDIFEDPAATREKFEKVYAKTRGLIKDQGNSPELSKLLSLAYRLEFYMLTPEFATMFHLFRTLEGVENMEERYDQHISDFMAGLMEHSESIPEVEMLGETLRTLWTDNKRLAKESTCDILTGLLNRRGFFNAISPIAHLASRKGFKVIIAMSDIDNFKDINDKYGHAKGDEVLKFVSSVIGDTIRKADLAGRYGGEEFIIYADSKDEASAGNLCERLRKGIEDKTEAAFGFKVTVSIGASSGFIGKEVEKDLMSIIRTADQSLYKAKANGKNRVVIG